MEGLTKPNGIGEYELKACFECGPGCGADNENCGNCQHAIDAFQRLGELEVLISECLSILNKNMPVGQAERVGATGTVYQLLKTYSENRPITEGSHG